MRTSAILSSVDSIATRLGALDSCCPIQFTSLEYVDDVVAPVSSAEQADAVFSACDVFTARHGLRLNRGPGKTAALPIGSTRFPCDGPFTAVELFSYLGVTLDSHLLFEPHLQCLLHRSRDAFKVFWGNAMSLLLPLPSLHLLSSNFLSSVANLLLPCLLNLSE